MKKITKIQNAHQGKKSKILSDIKIKTCGNDNLYTPGFSLKYEPIKYEEGEIYIDKYAEENIWYKLSTICYKNVERKVKPIAINNNIIMQYISN